MLERRGLSRGGPAACLATLVRARIPARIVASSLQPSAMWVFPVWTEEIGCKLELLSQALSLSQGIVTGVRSGGRRAAVSARREGRESEKEKKCLGILRRVRHSREEVRQSRVNVSIAEDLPGNLVASLTQSRASQAAREIASLGGALHGRERLGLKGCRIKSYGVRRSSAVANSTQTPAEPERARLQEFRRSPVLLPEGYVF
jgi:hypothetical protein